MKWVRVSLRFVLVTVGVIALTSLGIDATQYMSGSQSALSIFTKEVFEESCPEGMTEVTSVSGTICADIYEASVGESCPVSAPNTSVATAENLQTSSCEPESKEDTLPWRNVTYHQAAQLCARAGKRLPTAEEWYFISLGTPDNKESCNIEGTVQDSGQNSTCVSGAGAYDTVGNVWEWVVAEVIDGKYNDRDLPVEGYVSSADASGVALETSGSPDPTFNNDYFISDQEGRYVMLRGGFYGSGEDAGLFSVHAQVTDDFATQAIGFRCVR